jgi:hypothetical protein
MPLAPAMSSSSLTKEPVGCGPPISVRLTYRRLLTEAALRVDRAGSTHVKRTDFSGASRGQLDKARTTISIAKIPE